MDRSTPELTPLEKRLKDILMERPDIRNHILTGEELSEYISWMADHFSHSIDTSDGQSDIAINEMQLPVILGDEVHVQLARRALTNPGDRAALEQLSSGYHQQSERHFFMTDHDISTGRMLRYMPGQWHTSDYFEVYYAPFGNCPVAFENETVNLSGGSVLIVAPQINHASPCYADDAVLDFFLIRASTFESVFFGQLPKDSLLASFFRKSLSLDAGAAWICFDTAKDAELFRLSQRMDTVFRSSGSYGAQLMNALMTEFFIYTLMKYENTARLPRTDDFYWKHEYSAILSFIQQNYISATLEDVAREFHYSSRQISRVVKNSFNLTYAQLVLKLKMDRAAELLRHGNVSVSAISEMLGYADSSSFYHAFTKYYGKPPRAYK